MKRFWGKVTAVFLVVLLFGLWVQEARAAGQFTRATIRYDRMQTGKLSSLQVIIVPFSTATEDKVILVFPSASVGSTTQATSTSNIPSYAIALPGIGSTALGSGNSIAIACSDLTVGTTYAFNLTVGVSTPAAGSYLDKVQTYAAGVKVDETTVASRIITNDQVVITANVPSSFTFILSGATDTFTADLSAGSVISTYGISVGVTTNASKGWTGWVKSANAALTSAATGESIGTTGTVNATPDTCQTGSDCYVLDVGVTSGSGSGSLTADAEYAGDGTSSGGTFSTTFQPFASRTGKTNGDTVWLKAHVTILGTKAAGNDYTDTWTVVGAGNF